LWFTKRDPNRLNKAAIHEEMWTEKVIEWLETATKKNNKKKQRRTIKKGRKMITNRII
jgi:hypothetical protein